MTTIDKPNLPYLGYFPGKMYPGCKLIVKGSVREGANGFKIDFKAGSKDIAFEFNPRFGQNYIVRNSYIAGAWGTQETSGGMPLFKGEPFEAEFRCFHDYFKVLLNGEFFCDFYHRMPYSEINAYRVEGDIVVDSISLPAPPE